MKSPALLRGLTLLLACLWLALVSALGQSTQLTYIGTQTIPTGTTVGGIEFGGISGLFYDPYSDRFQGITDDSRGGGRSRVWEIRLDYNGESFTGAQAISEVALCLSGGETFPVADTKGLNSKIQALKANARGFRSFANYRIRILFFSGKLNLHPL
jgi:hypothetical protein